MEFTYEKLDEIVSNQWDDVLCIIGDSMTFDNMHAIVQYSMCSARIDKRNPEEVYKEMLEGFYEYDKDKFKRVFKEILKNEE